MIYLLSISLLLLLLIVLYVLYKIGTKSIIFWIITPLLIFNVGYSWMTYEALKGWPYDSYPPDNTHFIGSTIQKPTIYVMGWTVGDKKPRLYAIPHTEENVRKVSQAQKGKEEGRPMMMGQRNNGKFEVYNFEMQEVYKK